MTLLTFLAECSLSLAAQVITWTAELFRFTICPFSVVMCAMALTGAGWGIRSKAKPQRRARVLVLRFYLRSKVPDQLSRALRHTLWLALSFFVVAFLAFVACLGLPVIGLT